MITLLINILLGLAGLIIAVLFTSRKYFKEGFDVKLFFTKGKWTWIWVILMVLCIAPLIQFVPGTALAIKSMTGLDVLNEPASFVSLGISLTAAQKATKTAKELIMKEK